jgi:L-lactate utilization protein LutB
MDVALFRKNLELRGYTTAFFDTAAAARRYLQEQITGKTVAFGGSVTLREMDLYETLREKNDVVWHWDAAAGKSPRDGMRAEVYLTSVNGASETGELVAIDGTGNRLSSMLYGHEKIYYVMGINKLAPDLSAALDRARNVAAPQNAKRLSRKVPCAADGRCHDCLAPECLCNAVLVLRRKMNSAAAEVVIVGEELGY